MRIRNGVLKVRSAPYVASQHLERRISQEHTNHLRNPREVRSASPQELEEGEFPAYLSPEPTRLGEVFNATDEAGPSGPASFMLPAYICTDLEKGEHERLRPSQSNSVLAEEYRSSAKQPERLLSPPFSTNN